MTSKTRWMREEAKKDYEKIRNKNNSKESKMTTDQLMDSLMHKREFYISKWSRIEAETEAQMNYQKVIFAAVDTFISNRLENMEGKLS